MTEERASVGHPPEVTPVPTETTYRLFQRLQAGDELALEQICDRFLPQMRRWARGRLPRGARSVEDTDDLVQDVLLQTVRRLSRFDYRREHALQAYLRRAIDNRIRNQLRHSHRRPARDELTDDLASREASTLEELVGRETVERYEAALVRLRPADREAVVAKVELDCSLEELAEALGKPTPDAARKAIARAILRLAREMASNG